MLSRLIWIRTVCKSYQQTTLGDEEFTPFILIDYPIHSAHVLLNLLNKLGKRGKMQGLLNILSLFCNKFNKFNNT